MKICLIASGWVPIIPGKGVLYGGGIESQVYGLAKALSRLCDEVHLITFTNEAESTETMEGIIYHKIHLPSKNPTAEPLSKLAYCDILFAYRSMRKHERLGVDIIHCNTKFPAVAALLSRKRRPIVFTTHNWKLWEGIKPEWKSPSARMAYVLDTRLEQYIAEKADKIVAISKAMKRGVVRSTHISSKKVDAAFNAVDTDLFYPEDANRIRSILYVGRITAEKGIDILIKAMPLVLKEIPDVKLVIVGPRKYGFERGGFEENLQRLITKLKIKRQVIFKGIIPLNELRKAYSQAAVFCLPSVWQEPFGLALIEAMACETPVIGTLVGGIPEIISESQAGILVRPGEKKDLAQAIIQLMSDANLARNLGRNGRRTVLDKYTFDRLARKIYSIYQDI